MAPPIENAVIKEDSMVAVSEKLTNAIRPLPVTELTLEEFKPLGIDTSLQCISEYIDEILSQIKVRRDQFLQAFATPIYKNPLEVLSNLQSPDYGELEMTIDFSNSMACILNVQLYLTLEKARENVRYPSYSKSNS
jgi:hypothetical protein